jgi:peptidoglycan/LPS O-acetylase OafA/YrhL
VGPMDGRFDGWQQPIVAGMSVAASPSDPAASTYVPAYDGLRFFLLLAVLEYHFLLYRVDIKYFWWTTYALCCFFVLSGFLITGLLLRAEALPRRRALGEFYLRRGLRVLPAYYAVVLLAHATEGLEYLKWHLSYLFNNKVFALSLDHRSVEFGRLQGEWKSNGIHLWSMGVEEQFYLLYPPLLLLTPARWRTPLLSGGLVASVVLRGWLSSRWPDSFYGALLPVAGEYLLWGCLLAWLDHQGRTRWAARPGVLYGSVLAFLTLVAIETNPQRYLKAQMQPPPCGQTFYAVTLAVFILALRYQPQAWLARLLAWHPFRKLGKISYSAYLVHPFLFPVMAALIASFPGLAVFPAAPYAVLGPLLSLLVACLMWVTFEARLNSAKDRLTSNSLAHPEAV